MDVKSDGSLGSEENFNKNEENPKKNLRSDSGISLDNVVDNKENLDKYNECEKKMDDEIICNLLKNVQKSLPSSGIGSDDEYNDEERSVTSKVDYTSLIEALSSCNLNKSKNNESDKVKKDELEKERNVEREKEKNVQRVPKESGSEIRDIKDIFTANKSNHSGKSYSSSKASKNEKRKEDKPNKEMEKLSSAEIMQRLSAKISTMNLANHQKSKDKIKGTDSKREKSASDSNKSVQKKSESSVNCNDKNHVQIIPRDTQNKKDKKYTILLERGPWSKPKSYGVRNENPFYQTDHQLINTNILSGGKFWTAKEPTDLMPQTIPDFESILTKPLTVDPKLKPIINNDLLLPGDQISLLEDTLTPTAIAEVLEREVLLFDVGLSGDNKEAGDIQLPNWGEYELVKNILEREAGNINLPNEDTNNEPPTIFVNEYVETNNYIEDQSAINELVDGSLLNHQFIVQSPSSDKLHEMSYGCQRLDQSTPTNQTATSFTFDNQILSNEISIQSQKFELPPTPTDLNSPVQLYSPADASLLLKIPLNSSNFYSPSPSIYSVNNGSPAQSSITESPRYSKTPNGDQEFFGIDNSIANQTYYSASFADSFANQVLSPNDSLLQGSTSNRSSFSGSDYLSEQCFTPPSADRIENQTFDNMYELSSPGQSRTAKESFSSCSPLESPEIYLDAEGIETFTNVLSQMGHVNGISELIQNSPENTNDICLQLNSFTNQTDYKLTQKNIQVFNNQNGISGPLTFINNESVTSTTTGVLQTTLSPLNQRVDFKVQKSLKQMNKGKPVPIAAKQSYPCCVKMKKNARDILEELFQRLNENMQSNVLLKIHTLDDVNLMKLLDSLLAGWSSSKLPIPKLPLLYVICERLLMTKTTMVKFFKTYGNGHTILDRALLTCPQNPILSRYIAECGIKAMESLQRDRDFELDKTDTLGNSIIHRAICSGVECASALAGILQLNTNGNIFNVNRLNCEGYSPLHQACSIHVQQSGGLICSCLIMTHILLEHGKSDPNIKDHKSGMTALHTAVNSNACGPALVSLLLKYGADPSIKNYYSSTALDLAKSACRSSNNLQCARQVVDILKKYKKVC